MGPGVVGKDSAEATGEDGASGQEHSAAGDGVAAAGEDGSAEGSETDVDTIGFRM
jgi:hypothetical protein